MFVDVLSRLERKDFIIAYSSNDALTDGALLGDLLEDGPLVLATAPKQVDDLALEIMVNAGPAPGGGMFVASARYADAPTEPDTAWHDAAWTSGKAKRAFGSAYEILKGAAYDAVEFEVGVMVKAEKPSATAAPGS